MEKYRKNLDEASDSPDGMRRGKRILNRALAIALAVSTVLPGCVYHRNGSNRPHILEYDHPDAEVVYPWRVTEAFAREYRLRILASITIWLAGPIEMLEGLAKIDPVKMLSIFPAIPHGFDNDSDRIRGLVQSSEERRQEENLRRRLEEARLRNGQ